MHSPSQAGDLRAEGRPRHVIGSEPQKQGGNYRALLKRVGLVLMGVGVLDIAYMVYCLSHDQSYSSSFNIFAVIAGVFLLRGSLGAVRLVTWFAAFMFAGSVGAIFVLFPFLMPAGLWAAEFRLDPVGLSISLLVGVAAIALLFWVYKQLRAAPVVAARVAAGHSASPPRFAFILGAALVALLGGIFHFTAAAGGAAGAKAVELAKARYGESYNYHVTAIHWSNGHVWATLDAYNEHEIKPVQVEWEQ